jgi:glycosyltransferase involved in cell wall biosynthesis
MSEKPIKFSLITATYNRSEMIPRMIRSIMNQTHQNWELIIVDGSPNDFTERVVKSFGEDRIKYVHLEKDKGMLHARNIGFDKARGDYIAMMDDDDELVSIALESAEHDIYRNPGYDIFWYYCVDAKTLRPIGTSLPCGEIYLKDIVCEKITGEHWQVFSRKALGKKRFDEMAWGAECLLLWEVYKCRRIMASNQVMRLYHHDHSKSVCLFSNQRRHIPEMVYNNKRILEWQMMYQDAALRARRRWVYGFWLILSGDKAFGKYMLQQSFREKKTIPPIGLYIAATLLPSKTIGDLYELISRILRA